eukprot:scaffold3281_cov286-Prasinococcus_capsulatus_cf.AAC.11
MSRSYKHALTDEVAAEAIQVYQSSKFCISPPARCGFDTHLLTHLLAGCVPVTTDPGCHIAHHDLFPPLSAFAIVRLAQTRAEAEALVRELEDFDEREYRRLQRVGLCIECKLYNSGQDYYFRRSDLLGKTILLRMGKLEHSILECMDD